MHIHYYKILILVKTGIYIDHHTFWSVKTRPRWESAEYLMIHRRALAWCLSGSKKSGKLLKEWKCGIAVLESELWWADHRRVSPPALAACCLCPCASLSPSGSYESCKHLTSVMLPHKTFYLWKVMVISTFSKFGVTFCVYLYILK